MIVTLEMIDNSFVSLMENMKIMNKKGKVKFPYLHDSLINSMFTLKWKLPFQDDNLMNLKYNWVVIETMDNNET